jgi:hypothetical protein
MDELYGSCMANEAPFTRIHTTLYDDSLYYYFYLDFVLLDPVQHRERREWKVSVKVINLEESSIVEALAGSAESGRSPLSE